jgi:osmotically-inducible protein OsmY
VKAEQTVAQVTGARVSLDPQDDRIVITGQVDSAEQRDAVIDIVTSLLPGKQVEDDLEIRIASIDSSDAVTSPGSQVVQASLEPESDDEGEPMLPATDPVVTMDQSGRLQILGGFSQTSLDNVDVEPSASGMSQGDLAIEDAVQRELREDAATTGLDVRVRVRRGIVHLTGRVAGPEDADAAESVAASVPGVREVVEEIEIGA